MPPANVNRIDPKHKAITKLKTFIKLCPEAKISKSRAKEMVDEYWPKKAGPWPENNQWWSNGPIWLQDLVKQYKFLRPILTELRRCRHLPMEKGMDIVTDTINTDKRARPYAIINLDDDLKSNIAHELGCSVSTLKRYLAALVKCGVLKEFHKGRRGRYYSISYWSEYPDRESNEWKYKKNPLLTKSTVSRLKNFKIDWSQ